MSALYLKTVPVGGNVVKARSITVWNKERLILLNGSNSFAQKEIFDNSWQERYFKS